MQLTTIRITKEVRDSLKQVGRKSQTYDEILRDLISCQANQTQKDGSQGASTPQQEEARPTIKEGGALE